LDLFKWEFMGLIDKSVFGNFGVTPSLVAMNIGLSVA
jgi:hypothetical protein